VVEKTQLRSDRPEVPADDRSRRGSRRSTHGADGEAGAQSILNVGFYGLRDDEATPGYRWRSPIYVTSYLKANARVRDGGDRYAPTCVEMLEARFAELLGGEPISRVANVNSATTKWLDDVGYPSNNQEL
jgi:hypothetical protein